MTRSPNAGPFKKPTPFQWFQIVSLLALLSLLLLHRWKIAQHSDPGGVRATLAGLNADLQSFKLDNGRYPTSAEGIQALIDCPSDLTSTWRQLRSQLPLDFWGHPYRYTLRSANSFDQIEIHSMGPDGIDGTADDIPYRPGDNNP